MKYRIDLDVVDASGMQTLEVEADSVQEAFEKLNSCEIVIVDHEVEVTELSEVLIDDIYEFPEVLCE